MRLHATLSLELDEARLVSYREELEEKDELDLFPGAPAEWTSILDLIDLIDHKAIVRTELLEVQEGPPPYRPQAERRAWYLRLFGGWR